MAKNYPFHLALVKKQNPNLGESLQVRDDQPSICVMCRATEETTKHLFQGCEWARQVWEEGGRSFGQIGIGEGLI